MVLSFDTVVQSTVRNTEYSQKSESNNCVPRGLCGCFRPWNNDSFEGAGDGEWWNILQHYKKYDLPFNKAVVNKLAVSAICWSFMRSQIKIIWQKGDHMIWKCFLRTLKFKHEIDGYLFLCTVLRRLKQWGCRNQPFQMPIIQLFSQNNAHLFENFAK